MEIDNFWTDKEKEDILNELLFLQKKNKLNSANNESPLDIEGNTKRNNKQIFVDDVYQNRNFSDILNINRKVYDLFICNGNHKEKNYGSWFFNSFFPQRDTTVINYYEDKEDYKPHYDSASVTCISFFYKNPKKFSGGELVLGKDVKINADDTKTILFPSQIKHTVLPTFIKEKDQNKQNGRFTTAQFLYQTS